MENRSSQKQTQAERSKTSKSRIIKEANRLFGERGYRGTKLADIANAAGLTEPGLLHHYPSKEHLLINVLEERDRSDQQRFNELFAKKIESNILDALKSLVEYNQSIPEMVRLFTVMVGESIDPDHPGHQFFINRYRFFRQQHIDLLKQAQKEGTIRSDIRVEDLGILVMALMDGLQIQWLLDLSQVDMKAVFSSFIQILDRGIHD